MQAAASPLKKPGPRPRHQLHRPTLCAQTSATFAERLDPASWLLVSDKMISSRDQVQSVARRPAENSAERLDTLSPRVHLQSVARAAQAAAKLAERLDTASPRVDHLQSVALIPENPNSAQAGAKLAERLDAGHEANCPWLGNACDASVAQFPPLARTPVLAGFQERAVALGRLDALPPIAPAAIAAVERGHRRHASLLLCLCHNSQKLYVRNTQHMGQPGALDHCCLCLLAQHWVNGWKACVFMDPS